MPLLQVKPIHGESLIKKLAVSFFFMSLIPILLIMYIMKAIGQEALIEKIPYIRWTVVLVVILVSVMFLFLRSSIATISKIIASARSIASGNYKKRINVADQGEVGQLAKSFNKITGELETKIKELEESKAILQDIFKKIGSAISSTGGIEQLLELIVETMVKGVFAEIGCIMLLDTVKDVLRVKVAFGMDRKLIDTLAIKVGEDIVGLSVKEKRAMVSSFVGEADKNRAGKPEFRYKTVVSVPMLYREECMGVLCVFNKKGGTSFNEDDKVLVSNVASQAAVAIANYRLNEDAEKTYIETISALAIAVEAKDTYSRGHLDRTARLIVDFAKQLNLSQKTIDTLKDGARMHDIGKIGIRDDILRKKEPLTPEEQKELQKHVIIGENIMRPIRKLSSLCEMVRHHQEWWDGSGYPDKLKGEDIPLTARILKIADAYDAMAIDRPYRKGLSKKKIREQFTNGSGKEFDPELVEKFLEMI